MVIDRSMSGAQVKRVILSQFKWVHSYMLLSLSPDGSKLEIADNQCPDGNEVVDKRGHMYLHEERASPFIVSWPFLIREFKYYSIIIAN